MARINFITCVLLYVIALLAFVSVDMQTFGVEIGVNFASNKVQFEDVNVSNSETEFYVGVFVQIEISEKVASQHEIIRWLVNDFDKIDIPLRANDPVLEVLVV